MRRVLLTIALLMLWCSRALALDESYFVRPTQIVNYGNTPYAILQNDPSIYRAQVARLATEPAPASEWGGPGSVRGQIALKVVTTLQGKKVDTLALPYHYLTVPPGASAYMNNIWPGPEELAPNKEVLVAVLEGPFKDEKRFPREARAAFAAYVISGANDPIVKAYETMMAMHGLRGGALTAAMRQAAKNPPRVMANYLVDAARERLQIGDAIAVTAELYVGRSYHGNRLAELAQRLQAGDGGRAAALRAILSRPEAAPEVLQQLLPHLAESSRYLTAAERAAAAESIKKSRDGGEQVERLVAWLTADKPVAYAPMVQTNFYWGQPFAALHLNGAVYAGILGERRQTSAPPATTAAEAATTSPAEAPAYAGTVSLRVVDTLRGEKQDNLTLGYSYHVPQRWDDRWPPLHQLPGETACMCIVLPAVGAGEGATLINYISLTGRDDPLVKTVKEMLAWDGVEGAALKAAMLRVAPQKLPRILRLLVDQTAMNRLSAADAIDVLLASMQSYVTEGEPEDRSVASAVGYNSTHLIDAALGPWYTSEPKLQEKVLRGAIQMSAAADDGVSMRGLELVFSMRRQMPGGPPALSAGERSALAAAGERFRKGPYGQNAETEIAALEKWLGGGR